MIPDSPQTGNPSQQPASPQPQAIPGLAAAQPPMGGPSATQQGAQTIGAAPGGVPSPPPPGESPVTIDGVMQLLRDGMTRRFRIDVETDSTIGGTEAQERQDRVALIGSITQLVEAWAPIVQANPIAAPLAGALMSFGARGFRVATELESAIEEFIDKMDLQSGQPPPPQQPDPADQIKLQVEQIKAQGTQAKTQAEVQKAQAGIQQAQMDAQNKAQEAARKHDLGIAEMNMKLTHAQMQHEAELKHLAQVHQLELQKAVMEAQLKQHENAQNMQLQAAQHHQNMQHSHQQHQMGMHHAQQQGEIKIQQSKEMAKVKPKADHGKR